MLRPSRTGAIRPLRLPHIDAAFEGDDVGRLAFIDFAMVSLAEEMTALERVLATDDFAGIARRAHALKGGLASLDAIVCVAGAQRLVTAAESGDRERVFGAWCALYRRYVCFRWMVASCKQF